MIDDKTKLEIGGVLAIFGCKTSQYMTGETKKDFLEKALNECLDELNKIFENKLDEALEKISFYEAIPLEKLKQDVKGIGR